MDKDILLLVLGAIIGGLIGFLSSYFSWKININYNKKNIAKGFYIEISSLENTIKLYSDFLKKINSPFLIPNPIYENGLFYTFQKEIFSFNKELSEKLFNFYSNLILAEKDRKVAEKEIFFKQANEEMRNSIINSYNHLPELKMLLEKEINKLSFADIISSEIE